MVSLIQYLKLLSGPSKIMPIINWTLLIILGFLISNPNVANFLNFIFYDPNVLILSLILIILSINCAWIFTASINDYYDIELDNIANPTRPLSSGDLNKKDVKKFFIFFAILALIFSFICSLLSTFWIIILVGICLLLGTIYSTPPIRIKMRTSFSTIVIGLGSSISNFAGGILITINDEIIFTGISLGLIAFLASLAKDFKDIDGDKATGIPTLPIKYGSKKTAKILLIIGALSYSGFFLYPVFKEIYFFSYPVIFYAIISWIIIFIFYIKKPEKERGELIYKLGFMGFLSIVICLIILNFIY